MEPTKCTEQEKAIAAVAASQCTIPNCEACAAPPFSMEEFSEKVAESKAAMKAHMQLLAEKEASASGRTCDA